MPGRLADLFQHLPAARAFVARGRAPARRATPATSGRVKAPAGASPVDQVAARGDADLGEVEALDRREVLGRGMDMRRRLQAGADALLGALELERAGDDAAQRAHRLPLLAQRRVEPGGRDRRDRARRCTLSAAPSGTSLGRASQASSAVKQVIGASQAVRKREQLGHHRARGAPAQRRRARRSRARPCGCRSRSAERSTAQKLCSSVAIVWKSKSSTACRNMRVELGQAMQHPALELRHVGVGRPSRPPRSRRGCPAGSAACCAAGDRRRPGASGSPGRCAGPRRSRCRPPTGAGCRRRTGRTPSCGAMTLPSDFDILRPCSSSVKPCVSTPS